MLLFCPFTMKMIRAQTIDEEMVFKQILGIGLGAHQILVLSSRHNKQLEISFQLSV